MLGLRNDEDESDASDTALDRSFDEMLGWALTRMKQHPEFKSFVREEASALLADLAKDAALQALVKAQADAYLDYLRAHPERIQALVRQQSQGAASGLLDVLRVRAARADDWVESILGGRSKRRVSLQNDEPSALPTEPPATPIPSTLTESVVIK